ncbi:MAG: dUTP diphosphatase [Rickettsiales bacterium]|jgi:dUTP pyrophosphatase|nr:dUTP diphosphatase [Rickettsiales bacterium]
MAVQVKFKKLDPRALIPQYRTGGSAGLDLHALLDTEERVLRVGEIGLFTTGLAMALPEGYEAQIRSRSGLSLNNGIVVLNSPGTIDSDYRGEIGMIVINHGKEDFIVKNGMRLAQMVIASYERAEISIVTSLDSTAREAGGFGSTGVL